MNSTREGYWSKWTLKLCVDIRSSIGYLNSLAQRRFQSSVIDYLLHEVQLLAILEFSNIFIFE